MILYSKKILNKYKRNFIKIKMNTSPNINLLIQVIIAKQLKKYKTIQKKKKKLEKNKLKKKLNIF